MHIPKGTLSKLYYLSPYLPKEEKYHNHYSPAAQAKVEYIRSKLTKFNAITVCVNCSLTVDDAFFMPKTIVDEKGECRILISKSSRNRMFLPFCGVLMLMSVFFFVLLNVNKNDKLILYHSIYYDWIVIFLKKIKKFKIIYEVEEIYADVRDGGVGREKEIARCEHGADAFIFPTEMLDRIVNINNKPCAIIYGAYNPYKKENIVKNKTIIVYSGTLMKGKGAAQAVECAQGLDEQYEVRIIGYGSAEEVKNIGELILNNESSCLVEYDGMKLGDEYFRYLLNCDIGICVQPSESLFNISSFPSKILNYFNCGLKVVVSDMETLRESKLASYMFFAKDTTPLEIAKTIKRAQETYVDGYSLLRRLDKEAAADIKNIISSI